MTRGGRSVLREPFRLVLDLGTGLGQRVGVLAAVVSAEEQLSRREDDTYVRLGTAAVTQVHGGQRLAGSHSTGHVALPRATGGNPAGVSLRSSLGHRFIDTQHPGRHLRSHPAAAYAKSERLSFAVTPACFATVSCALSQVMRVGPAACLPPEPGRGG